MTIQPTNEHLSFKLKDAVKWSGLYRTMTGNLAKLLYINAPAEENKFTAKTFDLYEVKRINIGSDFLPFKMVSLYLDSLKLTSKLNLNHILGLDSESKINGLDFTNLTVLDAPNVCKLDNEKYLFWSTENNGSSEIFIVILDLISNIAYIGSTSLQWPRSCYEIFDLTMRQYLPLDYYNKIERLNWLESLSEVTEIVFVTKPFTNHFGNYILNDYGPLSHLEDTGKFGYFAHIYRSKSTNKCIFSKEDEKICFSPSMVKKFMYSDNPLLDAKKQKYGVILYKDAIVSRRLGENIRCNLASSKAVHEGLSICVGLRGGSREALNLQQALHLVVGKIYLEYGQKITIIVDGMSKLSINDSHSHALLSVDRERQVSESIYDSFKEFGWVNVISTVGLELTEQLNQITDCLFSFVHSGTNILKYGYLAGLPTLVHSKPDAGLSFSRYNLNTDWDPLEKSMGLKPLESIQREYSADELYLKNPMYNNYYIDLSACQQFLEQPEFSAFLSSCFERKSMLRNRGQSYSDSTPF
jgi:hypothetical protein